GDHLAQVLLRSGMDRVVLAGRVALQAGVDRGTAAGARDAQGDQEDRQRRHPCDDDRRWFEHRTCVLSWLVAEAEQARGKMDAHRLELFDELGANARWLEAALDAAVDVAGLVDDERVLHAARVAFRAMDHGAAAAPA